MKKLILVIGAPASGKTSVTKNILNELFDFHHFSMGEKLREYSKKNSEKAMEIRKFLNKGITVPIAISIKIMLELINSTRQNNIIIDGFPRDAEQLREFENKIRNKIQLKGVIEISVNKNIAKSRALNRKRGSDDTEQKFNKRMLYYNKYKSDIINYYKTQNIYFSIDGNKSMEIVSDNLQKLVSKII